MHTSVLVVSYFPQCGKILCSQEDKYCDVVHDIVTELPARETSPAGNVKLGQKLVILAE